MNRNGWEQLDCKFFARVCRDVLGGYLEGHEFKEKRLTDGGGVVYSRSDIFIEVNYDTNLFPEYTIRVVVGFGDGAFNKQGGFSGVPMWYVLPHSHPYRTQVYWTFSNEEELSSVLKEVKAEFFESNLSPLLVNDDELERLVGRFQREADSPPQKESARHDYSNHRRNATKAFSEENYRDFIQEISRIPESQRSAVEMKKLSYALRHVN